ALPAETGARVSLMDMIRTKSNSRVEITLNDGTVIRLAQGSRFQITGYPGDENEGSINLFRGKMRMINTSGSPLFQVLTPNAKADNMEGTDFYFIHEKGSTWFYGTGGTLQAASILDPAKTVSITRRSCVRVAVGIPIKDSCVFNDIDEKKYDWDTAATENVPVVAQLPTEGEVYTYTPLGGRAIDTPSMPVTVASDDLTCTQCPMEGIPLVAAPAAIVKMGNFERIDSGCCEPVPPVAPPLE
ncbi:MAG: FecR family protein, partial [Nitrospirota bacterium]